jgi:hypothetical protein
MSGMNVVICGGGNAAHAMAGKVEPHKCRLQFFLGFLNELDKIYSYLKALIKDKIVRLITLISCAV